VPDSRLDRDTYQRFGAGRLWEFIVDIGALLPISAGVLSAALTCAQVHNGRPRWSIGILALPSVLLRLTCFFLIGAPHGIR